MVPYLEIDENEDVLLPKEYHKINNLCAIIYDQLTEIPKNSNYNDLRNTSFAINKKDKLNDELKRGEIHIFDWFKENGRKSEIEIVIAKEITSALLADFLNFMFESMYSAQRGKMTVAYALLRKPLTDELLIFEQLLINRADFINRFYFVGNPIDYDPSNKNIDKQETINKAINKIQSNLINDSKFIYDLRYNKTFKPGINGISNQSLHIVTRDKNYLTPNNDLNFIFSQVDSIQDYYKHYYTLVPLLLIYSASIIDELVFSFLKDSKNNNIKILKEFRRFIGYLLLTEYTNVYNENDNKELYDKLSMNLKLSCPRCNKINAIERADCKLFFETGYLLCTKCFENLLLTNESVRKIENILF